MRVPVTDKLVEVALYILSKQGPMTGTKLAKLLYYSQAWHLVWHGEPLFGDRIEAWAGGPMFPGLWDVLKAGECRFWVTCDTLIDAIWCWLSDHASAGIAASG
jgi:uncharacterized phage-associated protein